MVLALHHKPYEIEKYLIGIGIDSSIYLSQFSQSEGIKGIRSIGKLDGHT